jgi:hypothetical protein
LRFRRETAESGRAPNDIVEDMTTSTLALTPHDRVRTHRAVSYSGVSEAVQ